MDEAIGFLGRPDAGFLPLVVIGALSGWLVGAFLSASDTLFADMAVGVAGAWLGAQFADLCGLAVEGSIGHFLAGLLGSIIIVSLWAESTARAVVGASDRIPARSRRAKGVRQRL